MLEIFAQNILSPIVLFFLLGAFAGILKSDLSVPESMGRYLSIYIMMSIGFTGGVSVSCIESFSYQILITIFAAISLSFLIPFLSFALIRWTANLDTPTAAALASHYGSVSIVTFAASVNFLILNQEVYSGYMSSILALMEAPAIVSGLYIAHIWAPETNIHAKEQKKLASEIFANGAVLLILGSFFIGAVSGRSGLEKVSPFLVSPFQGILCMFMLDMGLIVTGNIQNLRKITSSLVIFGIYMPLINSIIGLVFAYLVGLNKGDGLLFMTLIASSSYIAVPAAMRLALPEAKESIYLPISLGVTFPFNIIIGIPFYYFIANLIL
ncbi:MAG: sodium-dependent bicarbonate transport family permease [Alphaproteobacteria bacterium]|nr:sodium-dependent bicarbonate transport family permease [Alphaproteobacteria bacterium]